jgi:hypothetical protein
MKRFVAIISLAVVVGTVVSCSPEPMSTSQACKAWREMEFNSPKTSELISARYTIDYYRDFSTRIDGRLGDAFQGMIKSNQATIDSPNGKLPDSEFDNFVDVYGGLLTMCGNPANH